MADHAPGAAEAVADGPLRTRPAGAQIGMWAVALTALALLAVIASRSWPPTMTMHHAFVFSALAALGAVAVLDVVPWWQPVSARRPDGTLPEAGTFVDIADLFFVAAALLLGPFGTAVVSLPSFVVDQVRSPARAYKQIYNAAAYIIGGVATWATYHGLLDAFGVTTGQIGRPGWLVAALTAALVFEAVNLAACTFARWTMHGQTTPVRDLLRLYPVWTETGACGLAVIMAALWMAGHWLVIATIVPILILRQTLYLRDLQAASRTDSKTGLVNMTHFSELAERELRRALRQRAPMALLVADLDHLRAVNSEHGHLAGDAVLIGVASILRGQVREFDVVCRFGGEEFLVLLPDATLDVAEATAERLRESIEAATFHATTTEAPLHATISIGVAALRRHGVTVEELMHAADLAVYRAKADGRNRVRVALTPAHAGVPAPSALT